MPRTYSSFLLIFILFILQVPPVAAAEKKEPYFENVILTTSETSLLLFGGLKYTFSEDMLRGLHSGIPIQYSFFVEVNRARRYWTDEQVASVGFTHTLRYDTLKETYRVEIDEGTGPKIIACQTLTEAQKVMNEFNGVNIVKLSGLVPDDSYTLRVRAELYKKNLPMGLHHVVPFVSFWDIETSWYSVDFNY
ncbi:MAG: DUF4390 domain-containing protein [Desulfocapsaceae bacterium]|nr:DUF4390 domain-containing protein [Desulfocapsaceae bacterium]